MYTVLVISCHPDDIEIACAGTLLRCKERGDRVVICHLSSGNLGHEIIPPEELTQMRAKEVERAAEIGGFEVIGDKGLVLGQFFGKRAQKVGKSVDFENISKQRLAMQESFFVSANIALCVIKKAIFCDDLRSDVKIQQSLIVLV